LTICFCIKSKRDDRNSRHREPGHSDRIIDLIGSVKDISPRWQRHNPVSFKSVWQDVLIPDVEANYRSRRPIAGAPKEAPMHISDAVASVDSAANLQVRASCQKNVLRIKMLNAVRIDIHKILTDTGVDQWSLFIIQRAERTSRQRDHHGCDDM